MGKKPIEEPGMRLACHKVERQPFNAVAEGSEFDDLAIRYVKFEMLRGFCIRDEKGYVRVITFLRPKGILKDVFVLKAEANGPVPDLPESSAVGVDNCDEEGTGELADFEPKFRGHVLQIFLETLKYVERKVVREKHAGGRLSKCALDVFTGAARSMV